VCWIHCTYVRCPAIPTITFYVFAPIYFLYGFIACRDKLYRLRDIGSNLLLLSAFRFPQHPGFLTPYSFFLPISLNFLLLTPSIWTHCNILFFPLSIYLVQTTCFVKTGSIFFYICTALLSTTAFWKRNMISLNFLRLLLNFQIQRLVVVVPIEHFRFPLGIIWITQWCFFFQKSSSWCPTQLSNSPLFSVLHETGGTLAAKLMCFTSFIINIKDSFPVHNSLSRSLLNFTTTFKTPSMLTAIPSFSNHLILIQDSLQLIQIPSLVFHAWYSRLRFYQQFNVLLS
jgi:hypothetical protein